MSGPVGWLRLRRREVGRALLAGLLLVGLACSPALRGEARPMPTAGALGQAQSPSARIEVEAAPEPARTPEPTRTSKPAAPTEPAAGRLAARLDPLLEGRAGGYGLVVEHVPSGERFERNPRRVFESGSVYKLLVAWQLLRRVDDGAIQLDRVVRVEPDDASEPEPAGGPTAGDELTVRELLEVMMEKSSNSAAHVLLRLLGRAWLNAELASLGLRDTHLSMGWDESTTTVAADMALPLELLARDRILSAASRDELRALLALREPYDPLPAAVPAGTLVLSKAGTLERASNVAGLVMTRGGPVLISFLSEDVEPGEARHLIGKLGQAVCELYADAD